MISLGDELRFAARNAGLVGVTLAFLAALELERLRAPERGLELASKWMRRYGERSLALYGLDVVASGPHLSAREPYPGRDSRGLGRIFVMNHRSMLDIFVSLSFIEATFVSRADLARWPLIGFAARRVGTLFVDRDSRQSGAKVLRAMITAVRAGRGVLVYPEGTTFAGDEIHPFRAGSFRAAAETGAEIVPLGVAYERADAAFTDESFARHWHRITSRPRMRVALAAGEPWRGDPFDPDATRERAYERVRALVQQARASLVPRCGPALEPA